MGMRPTTDQTILCWAWLQLSLWCQSFWLKSGSTESWGNGKPDFLKEPLHCFHSTNKSFSGGKELLSWFANCVCCLDSLLESHYAHGSEWFWGKDRLTWPWSIIPNYTVTSFRRVSGNGTPAVGKGDSALSPAGLCGQGCSCEPGVLEESFWAENRYLRPSI